MGLSSANQGLNLGFQRVEALSLNNWTAEIPLYSFLSLSLADVLEEAGTAPICQWLERNEMNVLHVE